MPVGPSGERTAAACCPAVAASSLAILAPCRCSARAIHLLSCQPLTSPPPPPLHLPRLPQDAIYYGATYKDVKQYGR